MRSNFLVVVFGAVGLLQLYLFRLAIVTPQLLHFVTAEAVMNRQIA